MSTTTEWAETQPAKVKQPGRWKGWLAVGMSAAALLLSGTAVVQASQPGPQGPQGVAGAPGPEGPQGPQGDRGPRGHRGPAGLDGAAAAPVAPDPGAGAIEGGGTADQSVQACHDTYGQIGMTQAQIDQYCQPGGAWNP